MSPSGPTRVTELDGDSIRERVITPDDFGLHRIGAEALAGGDAAANAKLIEAILRGEPHPARARSSSMRPPPWWSPSSETRRALRSKSSAPSRRGARLPRLERWRAAALRARAG